MHVLESADPIVHRCSPDLVRFLPASFIRYDGAAYLVDFVERSLAISQEIVQPSLKRLNRFWRITFGIDPHFDFVPRCVQVEEARARERGEGSRVSSYEHQTFPHIP